MTIHTIGDFPTEQQISTIVEMLRSGRIDYVGAREVIERFSFEDPIWRFWESRCPGKGLEISNILRPCYDIDQSDSRYTPSTMNVSMHHVAHTDRRWTLSEPVSDIDRLLIGGFFRWRLSGSARCLLSPRLSSGSKGKTVLHYVGCSRKELLTCLPIDAYFDSREFLGAIRSSSGIHEGSGSEILQSWERQYGIADVWEPIRPQLEERNLTQFASLKGDFSKGLRSVLWRDYTLIMRWMAFCSVQELPDLGKELRHLLGVFHSGNYLRGFIRKPGDVHTPIVIAAEPRAAAYRMPIRTDD